MGTLKNIGYVVLSIVGICAVVALSGLFAAIGALFSVICIGGGVVTLVAMAIKEYVETPKDRDT